jgi:hypothetical protein
MMTKPSVYEWNPDAAPDSAFRTGELADLAVGNRGRLLDARRTPVTVVGVPAAKGAFVVRIDAFEDKGRTWELWLGEVERFQFQRDGVRLTDSRLAELQRSVDRFDRDLVIDCEPETRRATLEQLRRRRLEIRRWLDRSASGLHCDLGAVIEQRVGEPVAYELLEAWLDEHELSELDRVLASALVTNPHAGEVVKGHAIVLAEIGLSPYHGKIVRDPALFAGHWSRVRRADHLMWRLAFTQELWKRLGARELTLYRAFASDGALPPRSPGSFISATLSREVAEAHFAGGPTTQTAAIWRQVVPIERVLMTFVETRAMNERFHEAEAVLLPDPMTLAF